MTKAVFADAGSCWVCGCEALSPFDRALFELSAYRDQDPELASYTGASVALRRCRSCGFVQPEHLPALPRFFERMYSQLWSADWVSDEFTRPSKDLIFRRVLDGLDKRVPHVRRTLLDIGSHAGRFISFARERGWSVEGLEVNERTASHAEARTGATIHRIRAGAVDSLEGRFDAVTLTDVLEHLPEPVDVLTRVQRVLQPGGWVAIKLPCGPAQRVKERARAWLQPGYQPRLAGNLVHVNHFSPRSLHLALQRSGFESISIELGAPELPGGRASNMLRLAIFCAGRVMPLGVHSPCALNLQAFARAALELQ
jgi:SAM-dependent methyltransferase